MYNYNEFNKLVIGLMNKRIPFSVEYHLNGRKVDCGNWDAVINNSSYGNEKGLLEIYGEIVRNDYDEVEGWLTAEEILSRL